MHPRTCSRCNDRIDASGVLTVALHVTPDGGIIASRHHVCAPCLAREAAQEMETARQTRPAPRTPAGPYAGSERHPDQQ